uniref:mRNA interferase YafQ n=1 Tax=Candidatus Kentrum sp. FM TaxID=2126340 RepID=A0A450VVD7_9GAMM|nr:MAG: mRNA interferase YafQ [Candidatus Kentron sp. FM]VFJ50734.1 MAG: mRNA interferase YafQ [Candidatus Kentron sp. FM]VFK08742.1 MAG: mRNA interferase YafQ [Candidatus Kentron sp. FM]
MNRKPEYSGQFRRDVKRVGKRGNDMEKLKELMRLLLSGESLPVRYKDHPLRGNWSGCRDAHIEPDWILIYYLDGDTVRFERTGTHADLFEN